MAESKYGKYICTELKQEVKLRQEKNDRSQRMMEHVIWMDNDVIPGAFYSECVWVTPPPEGSPEPANSPGGATVQPHKHDYDEVLAFFGTNQDDPRELGAEVELWLGDEKHILTKSCMVFVPAGLQHCPLRFNRVDRPVFYFTSGPGKMYF